MEKQNMKNECGVISLEACIVLPIFFFLILFFYGLMFLFAGEQIVNHAMIQSAVSLSLDSYGADKLAGDQTSEIDQLMGKLIDRTMTSSSNGVARSSRDQWYKDSGKTRNEIKKRFVSYVANGDENYANTKLEQFGIVGGLSGIKFEDCKVEGKVLTIKIKYEQKYLMDAFDQLKYTREKTIKQRLW